MKIKYSILALLGSGFLMSPLTFAELSFEQELQQGCAKVKSDAALGKKYYDQKQYNKAVPYFERQAAWTQFCQFNEDQNSTHFSDRDVELAHNNVGLTYAKLGKPLWARAWFLRSPSAKISQYNLKQLKLPKVSNTVEGLYVRSAGYGQWSTIKISKTAKTYKLAFDGYYFGLRGLIYGPNMGSFETRMPFSANQASYRYEDCKIDLKLGQDQYGRKIEVQQNENNSGCGFGHNVYAGGTYYQVEN
ncbi:MULTISPECIES: hypothetical protein [unclassified Acinetobacter]|uniref:hypothetical protein n=1 Tax=unclassified Acinetobacter TaxID=196816 RepID=UPI00190CA765|nr:MULTISPECIES: hypothetical protein [unclassified Acinetobacter]MBK0063544.1 hypothetical protein [Acinetobacter sp. S55]MBK0065385.1 hypothetical protein [Acinetobacter sp. S54]